MHDRWGAAGEVERVPDVRAAPQDVGPPPVTHVDRIGPERQVERVLRVVGSCALWGDVRLAGPGAGKGLT